MTAMPQLNRAHAVPDTGLAIQRALRVSARRVGRTWMLALMLAGAGALVGPVAEAAPFLNDFDLANATIAIDRGGPPKDGIPAIDKPRFVRASGAALTADDRVLGIVLGGKARAYPVRILNWHEVVNDRLGGRTVVVTYCPLCGTGMAFEPPAATGSAGFGVSGLLHNSDVLLYDRATESLWSQILSTAISGKLKDTRLQSLPLTHTSWADWRQRHPDTEVLSTDTGFERDYGRDPYAGYATVPQLLFDVQHHDARFPVKAWVLGVQVNGTAKAYPFSVLDRAVGAHGELRDQVGGQALRIRYDRAHHTAEAVDAQGQPVPGVMSFWFAWVAFHPRTEVLVHP